MQTTHTESELVQIPDSAGNIFIGDSELSKRTDF